MISSAKAIEYDIREIQIAFDSLSVYRNLLNDETNNKLYKLIKFIASDSFDINGFINLYNDFFYSLAYNPYCSFKMHIINLLLYDENPYSLKVETRKTDSSLYLIESAVLRDLSSLQMVSNISSSMIKSYVLAHLCDSEFEINKVENLPPWGYDDETCYNDDYKASNNHELIKQKLYMSSDWAKCVKELGEYYTNYGCGIFAKYKAFIWGKSNGQCCMRGIDSSDPVRISELIGYELERSKVVENTLQFLNGYSANNVLLYGDKGTGKSSTVKALLNEYEDKGLRIIEVPKAYLRDFPDIIRYLKDRVQKFIIFVDDLSFEGNEESYTALKAVLEGGVESKPKNVLIYATSNRRHLVKEKFSDRTGMHSGINDEEIFAQDTIQEKMSLADRFGITVVFLAPDKSKYLKIVEGIAAKRGISIDKETLHSEALKWEVWYNGRSPRTARQFVDWLEGQVGV